MTPTTHQYDIDILNEIGGDDIASAHRCRSAGWRYCLRGRVLHLRGYEALPEGYLALPFVMFAQAISLLNSVRVGNTPGYARAPPARSTAWSRA